MISKGTFSTVKDGRFFLSVCKSAALLLFFSAKTMALACGYDDPKSAAGQRAALNLSYPNALDVVGAVAQARLDGVLPPTKDFSEAPNFFAYQAVNRLLQRFGGELGEREEEETADFAFTLVLVEPMLRARFAIEHGKLATSVHVSGPQPGDLVVVSSEAVLRQLMRLTHTGLPNAEQCASHAEGWVHYLGRLAEVAAGRDPGPDPWHARTG